MVQFSKREPTGTAVADDRPRQLHLELKTDLELLGYLLQQFESFVWPAISQQPTHSERDRAQELYWQCQIALAEGFTNVVRHAHHDLPRQTPIDIYVALQRDYLEIQVWDCGEPFDIHACLRAALARGEDFTSIGGRGVLWMYKLMDVLDYIRTPDGRNYLLLGKYLHTAA